ncbi:unnamed protein product [Rhodiola kirilowii]
MKIPNMFKTLNEKNPDDDAQASTVSVVDKVETFYGGRDVSNVNSDEVCVEDKMEFDGVHEIVGVSKEEGNLARSAEIGNECLDKGSKFNEFGSEEAGFENAGGELKEDVVFLNSLEVLENVLVHQEDLGEDATKSSDDMEIQVDKLVVEEQPLLLEENIKVSVSSDVLVEKHNVVTEEGSFSVGDLVWCMAKNNIWWPALVCDPLDVPKQATKSRDPEKLLVRHFGSKTMVWCPPSHLKHFLGSFKEMSGQGKSKSFIGAIEKAAEEVGRRMKLEMTCSCISKEIRARLIGRNKEDFKPWYVSNESVVIHFDPKSFLKRVKNLAKMSDVPGIVEIVAIQSNVSAYYSFYGHSQMFLRQLRDAIGPNGDETAEESVVVPTENTEEDIDLGFEKGNGQSLDTSMMEESPKLSSEGTAEKGFESRERKKSKYLSFPFVDPSATKAFRDLADSSDSSGKRNSSSSKRLLGKSTRKFATATLPGDLKDLKVSSAQLLTELRDTSRGCFYLNGNTILTSTFDFFCEFRRFAFSDGDSASNWYNDEGVIEKEELEVQVASPLSEVKPAKKQRKNATKKLEALNAEPTMDQVNDMKLKPCSVSPAAKPQRKSRKRKESAIANHQTKKTDGVLDLNVNGDSPKPRVSSSNKGKAPEANFQPKKRKNEQGTTASEPEHVLENGIINAKPISLVVDLFIDSHSLAGLMEANVETHFGGSPTSMNVNTASSLPDNVNPATPELEKDPEQMELISTDINSDKKAENPVIAETASGLPDLNGNGLEPNSSATDPKHSFEASMIPAPLPAAGSQELPLSVITNNLEMMTKMLDQSGSSLSPDMRAKLENDVQSLLKKVKDMTGSSLK